MNALDMLSWENLLSCSRSDLNKYLHMQCEIAQIPFPEWAYQWINIKSTFKQFYHLEPGRKLFNYSSNPE